MRGAERMDEMSVAPAFLGIMAHELSQPLSAALGSAQTIKVGAGTSRLDDETRARLLDITIRNLEQLRALLNSLQVFSDAEAGILKVETTHASVDDLFTDAQGDFGNPSSGTTVRFSSHQGLHVQVDLMLLRQVLSNIISNAAKFSPAGSLITVAARKVEGDVLFTISDQGEGFPPEEAERIFRKSVRLRPGAKGLGLGLFVAKAIVEAHGGRIWAENADVGARFSFTVPAAV